MTPGGAFPLNTQGGLTQDAGTTVYLQNTWARLKERQEGQTMAEYALILGLIAIFVMIAVFFLGGKIKDLFENTGSSGENAPNGLG